MSGKQTRTLRLKVITDENLKLYFLFFLFIPQYISCLQTAKVLKAQQGTTLRPKASVFEKHYIIIRPDHKKLPWKVIYGYIIFTCFFYLELKVESKENCSEKSELNKSSRTNHKRHLRLHFYSSLGTSKQNMQYFINFILHLNWDNNRVRERHSFEWLKRHKS